MSVVINDTGDAVETIVIALAERVTSDIFNANRRENGKVNRIQLMGGKYPDNEFSMGGFNQEALARFIAKSIDRSLRGEPFMPSNTQNPTE